MTRALLAQRGSVLPLVLIFAVALTALLGSSLDAVRSTARMERGLIAHIEAFHAADSALRWCERYVVTHALDIGAPIPRVIPSPQATPGWHQRMLFDGEAGSAIQPVRRWRAGGRAPQCLIEAVNVSEAGAAAYLLTARGFAVDEESEIWLQAIMRVGQTQRTVRTGWRFVARRPF
ncbi:pilus assembly PilX family protein [Mycetohabitans sp. B46]|uniref:pilus assembly PilX family protein n=1 Tax=Mycetohabitans sp. B46 TaxID=2772536 RepID=UPI00307F7A6E